MSLGKEFVPEDVACLHSIRRHSDHGAHQDQAT